jgi:mannose-1-phosphate guanylyltransferase
MNIVLLSGGSGKRLWPLSNDIRSKQFIKIFRKPDGDYESMAQRVYRQIRRIDKDAKVTVATSRTQVSDLLNQLGEEIGISVEPCRRDTFPAIALATAYLQDVMGVSEEEPVVVCPVDPYVQDDYFDALKQLGDLAAEGRANLCLMGIEPTYPSEKYGYIIPENTDPVSPVSTFREKPDTETAREYIAQGALWNGGVFAYKLGYVMRKAHELIDFSDYQDLFNRYEDLNKISFDYAVVEKEESIAVMRFAGEWKDLGTWNTLTESMTENTVGSVILADDCENVHVINELDIPVIGMGLKDVVVAASPDGILVSDKEQSGYLKKYVERLDEQVRYSEKSWGEYRVLDIGHSYETVKITVLAGHRMSYHSHQHRDEMWTVISGKGRTIVDGMEQNVEAGDVITMQAGCRHTVIAETDLNIIEVQIGREISVHDKQKYELER